MTKNAIDRNVVVFRKFYRIWFLTNCCVIETFYRPSFGKCLSTISLNWRNISSPALLKIQGTTGEKNLNKKHKNVVWKTHVPHRGLRTLKFPNFYPFSHPNHCRIARTHNNRIRLSWTTTALIPTGNICTVRGVRSFV